jgi:hypothetical protein
MLFPKKRKRFVTIGYRDDQGKEQVVVFELGKDVVRTTLPILEARSGKKIEYQDEEGICSLCVSSPPAPASRTERSATPRKTPVSWGERPSGGESWTDFQVGDYRDRRRESLLYVNVPRKCADRIRSRPGHHQLSMGTAERMVNGTPAVLAHEPAPLSTSAGATADGLPSILPYAVLAVRSASDIGRHE